MARNTVVVSILGQTKGLQSALGSADSSLGKFAKAAGAAGAVVGVALAAIGGKSIKSASELEQAMGGLQSVFKDNSGVMEKWANGAAQSVGLAKSEYASLATVLGSQLKNMGVSTDALAGQTNDLVGLGADLAAQFGGSTSDAVGALSSLLRGERDPIERYGVSINDAAIKAKLAEMGLSGLSGEAEKNAKLQATLALLTQQTADAQGAFARESTTLAGSTQRFTAGLENLSATFGTALLPAATAVIAALGALIAVVSNSAVFASITAAVTGASNSFADFVFGILNGTTTLGSIDFGSIFQGLLSGAVNGITSAADWLAGGGAATIINGLVSAREGLFSAALSVFPAILEALVVAIPAIVTGLVSMVSQLAFMLVAQAPIILGGAVQLFQGLVGALVTVLPGILTLLVGLLPQLVGALLAMVPSLLETAVSLFTSLVEALPLVIPPLITAIVDLLPVLVETVLGLIPVLLDAAINLFTALVEAIPVILPLLLTAVITLLPKLVQTVVGMIPKLLDAAVKLFTGIVEAIPKIVPSLISTLIELAPVLIGTILGLIPQLIRAGIDLIGGLVKGLFQAAGSVGKALLDIAKGAIGGFLSFLGIKSPSRMFMGFGDDLGAGLAIGITKSGRTVSKALDGMSLLVSNGFDASLSGPELVASVSASKAGGAPVGNVYNIHLSSMNPTAETGRLIVQAIGDYERSGGRL